MKLTKQAVDALQLGGKTDLIVFDAELKGFGVRVRVSAGGKVRRQWIVQWKRNSLSRRHLLGSADVLSAAQARDAARKVLARVSLGEDVQATRRERRAKDTHTLKATAAEYLAAKRADWAERTAHENERYLIADARFFGPLHRMAIDTISLKDVASRLLIIQRECGNATATRARSALAALFTWCMRQGLCASNPTIGSERPKMRPRERVLSVPELRKIWLACGDGSDHSKIVRLLVLLASRRGEVGGLRWSELDLEAPTWELPSSRSKSKRKHILPLLPLAAGIIRSVPRRVSNDCLFGSRNLRGFSSWSPCKQSLDQRCGVAGWTIHDVRRSTSTHMAEQLAVQPHVVEEILGHQSGSAVARVYNRSSYQAQIRQALAMWERFIGLITDDRDLYAKHQAYLAAGDEQACDKASKTFQDAIAAGGGQWEEHIRMLIEGGERKVLGFPQQQSA
jgi:integrase